MRVVAGLAWARLRYRPARRLLVVLGLAAATVLPVIAQASAGVAAAQAVDHGIEGLPAGERSLIVSSAGVRKDPAQLATLDTDTRHALAGLTASGVRAELLFREIADRHGGAFFLGAADDLASAVRVTSGRSPTSCTPTRCEVVVVGTGTPELDPAVGLVIVGRATRTDPLLLTGTFDPGHDVPLLLADGVGQAQQLASLELFQRAYGWVAPIDLALVRRLGVDGYVERSAQVADQLATTHSGLVLTAPDDVLRAEDARAQLSARRFALLAGAATALLLGFAAVAAIGLRSDQLAFEGLLRRRGARRRTVRALAVVEAFVPVAAGTVLGLLVGAVVALVMGSRAGQPAGQVATGALAAAWPAVVVASLLAVVVVAVTSSWPVTTGARTAWRVVDAVVLVGFATVALAIARGTVGTAALTGGTDPLLEVLPVVGVVCGGLLAGRAWPWLATGAGRLLPRGRVGARLGLLGAVRRPLRAVATVAFVTAAVAVVVFTGSYRATLAQGAVDQAAFAVPLDARLTVGPTLDRPLDVSSPAALAALAPGLTVHPVVRSSASVRVSGNEAAPVEVVGVDPAALGAVTSWTHVVGGLDPETAKGLLSVAPPPSGLVVTPGTTRLVLPATGDTEQLQVVAWVRLADGRDLGVSMTRDTHGFSGPLPTAASGGRFFAFTMAEDPSYATRHQHNIGEKLTDLNVLGGRLVMTAPAFAGAAGWAGWGSDSTTATPGGRTLTVVYAFTGARLVVRSDAAVAPADVPVLVDPATAARASGGLLQLGLGSGPPLRARVVGVVPRFPTVGAAFVVADVADVARALDDREPGTGAVSELWLAGPEPVLDAALSQPPYDRLSVDLRAAEQARLATDPLARGASALLVWSSLLALAVAVVAVVLLVIGERRDDAAELYAWESDGVAPATLRTSLFVRALSVVGVAVPAGLLVGLLLSRVTSALVTVTAVGTAATPPLALSVGPGWVAMVLAVALGVAVLAAAAVAGASLRERLPG